MMNDFPSRKKLAEVIRELQEGSVDRSQVSQWAFSIIDDDGIRVTDQVVWRVIQALGAVDLPSSDHDYLYGHNDFDDWLKMLDL